MAESSGGAGGMDWVALGSQIHSDSLESMNYFQQLEAASRARRRQQMLDAEAKRQFNRTASQTDRSQNLQALDYMSGRIDAAEARARQVGGGMSFRNALSQAIRG